MISLHKLRKLMASAMQYACSIINVLTENNIMLEVCESDKIGFKESREEALLFLVWAGFGAEIGLHVTRTTEIL
jgi:hypothetical protein